MVRVIFFLILILYWIGCGGSALTETQDRSVKIQGRVIDGYVKNATVFVDLDLNHKLSADEPKTKTDDFGYYELILNKIPLDNEIVIVAYGGKDIMFQEPLYGFLKAIEPIDTNQSQATINLSPLSTLAAAYKELFIERNVKMKDAVAFANNFAKADNLKEDSVEKFETSPNDLKQNIKLHRLVLSLTKLKYNNLDKENIYETYKDLLKQTNSMANAKTFKIDSKNVNIVTLKQAIDQEAENITQTNKVSHPILIDTTKNPKKYINTQEDSTSTSLAPENSTEKPQASTPKPPSPNIAPQAHDINITTNEDTSITANLNATDANSDTLSYAKLTNPTDGNLTSFNESIGVFTYAPSLNYCGTDSFTYKANDTKADSNIATVNINITCINDTPTANDFNITNIANQAKTINWIDISNAFDIEDERNLTASLNTTKLPAKGSVAISSENLTYTPKANQVGEDIFKLDINDTQNATKTITIHVKGIDTVIPTMIVGSSTPQNNQIEFHKDSNLTYKFDESINLGTITLKKDGTNIATTHALTDDNKTLNIKPTSLDYNANYTLFLTNIKDNAGNQLPNQEINFTTQARIYYVSNNGTGDGSSWANADSIQDAINNLASATDKYQIWLKQGTYQGSTIALKSGVKLYGGFSGSETKLSQRNFLVNKTIFDGQNTRRAFSANSVNNVILDGIIIQNANSGVADGAGLNMNNSSLEINNTIFQNNNTTDLAFGAGIYANGSGKLKVSNSSFINNKAQDGSAIVSKTDFEIYDSNFTKNINRAGSGGAIFNFEANLIIKNSNFTQNDAPNQDGGALYIRGATGKTTLIEDSNFTENKAKKGGAVMSNNSKLTIKNSNFTKNNATYGTAVMNAKGNNLIENSTFKENKGTNGAVYNETSKTKIVSSYFYKNQGTRGGALNSRTSDETQIYDSNFTQNTASHGGAFEIRDNSKVTAVSSNFIENTAIYGGAIKVEVGELEAKNLNFTKNEARLGGAIYLSPNTSGEIQDSKFIQNTATRNSGGAIYHNANNELKVYSSTFYQNKSKNTGGAIHINDDKKSLIVNSTFTANETQNIGGALYVSARGTINIVHSTFVNNQSKNGGADIAKAVSGSPVFNIINSIFWRDDSKNHLSGRNIIKKSIIKNGVGASVDVIETNPNLTPHKKDGIPLYYTPSPTSPAKDAGVTSSGISGITIPTTDQNGRTRDASPDIGSIEI